MFTSYIVFSYLHTYHWLNITHIDQLLSSYRVRHVCMFKHVKTIVKLNRNECEHRLNHRLQDRDGHH